MVASVVYTRTAVQENAREFFPRFISGIIAARSTTITLCSLVGMGICLYLSDHYSLQSILFYFTVPMFLVIPLALTISDVKKAEV